MAMAGTIVDGLRDEAAELLVSGISVDLLGHAGSGRSTLVASVTSALVERGWDVVRVQGVAALSDRPLEALALVDLVRRSAPRPTESPVTAAVARLRSAVADGRTVLVVDDADDLDVTSAGVIAAAHEQQPFPVLTTSRPRPSHRQAPVTLRSSIRPGAVLDVPSLDFVAVLTILAEVLPGEIEPHTLARIDAVSGGLPNLIVAVASAARRTGRIRRVDGQWVAVSDLWSPGLSRAVQPLIADLDEAALEALQMLALAGTVTVSMAAELVGWPALEQIDACGLLRFVPRGDDVVLGIFPPLIEERYRHLPLGARRLHFSTRMAKLLHHATTVRPDAATLLPRAVTAPWFWPGDGSTRDLSPRFERGRPTRDAAEVSDTVRARLMREDWHRRLLLRRREWENNPSPTTAAPYLRALLVSDAEVETMLDVVSRTSASPDQAQMAAFYRWQALVLAHAADDLDGARALLERAAPEVGAWAEVLYAVEDHLTLTLERVPEPRPLPANGDTRQFGATVAAAAQVVQGRIPEARAVLAVGEWTDPDMIRTRDVVRGMAQLVAGEVGAALAWSRQHLEEARDALDPEGVPGHAYVAVSALMLGGRVHEMRALLGSVLSIGLTSSVQRHYMDSLLELAAALATRDSLMTLDETSDRRNRTAGGRSPLPLPTWGWAITRTDPAVAVDAEETDQLWDRVLTYLDRGLLVSAVLLGGTVIEMAPDAGRVASLRAAVGSDAAGLLEAVVQVAEAAVEEDPAVGAALGRDLIGTGLVSLGVRAVGQSIRKLRGAGAGAEARELLDAIQAQLRGLGIDPDPLLGYLAPAQQLTPREQQVGSLVARGMTNAEIAQALGIAPKTVENHLNRMMRKASARDRSDIARAFRA